MLSEVQNSYLSAVKRLFQGNTQSCRYLYYNLYLYRYENTAETVCHIPKRWRKKNASTPIHSAIVIPSFTDGNALAHVNQSIYITVCLSKKGTTIHTYTRNIHGAHSHSPYSIGTYTSYARSGANLWTNFPMVFVVRFSFYIRMALTNHNTMWLIFNQMLFTNGFFFCWSSSFVFVFEKVSWFASRSFSFFFFHSFFLSSASIFHHRFLLKSMFCTHKMEHKMDKLKFYIFQIAFVLLFVNYFNLPPTYLPTIALETVMLV